MGTFTRREIIGMAAVASGIAVAATRGHLENITSQGREALQKAFPEIIRPYGMYLATDTQTGRVIAHEGHVVLTEKPNFVELTVRPFTQDDALNTKLTIRFGSPDNTASEDPRLPQKIDLKHTIAAPVIGQPIPQTDKYSTELNGKKIGPFSIWYEFLDPHSGHPIDPLTGNPSLDRSGKPVRVFISRAQAESKGPYKPPTPHQ